MYTDLLKTLKNQGSWITLGQDAGVLLQIVQECNTKISKDAPPTSSYAQFHIDAYKIIIHYDPSTFPIFRIYESESLIGYGILHETNVGRIIVKKNILCLDALRNLCEPCLCRSGHLLVVLLRWSDIFKCQCKHSFLKSMFDSYNQTKFCPLTFSNSISREIVKRYALLSMFQRKRYFFALK